MKAQEPTADATPIATSSSQVAAASESEKFIGTWKLVSAVNEEQTTGRKTDIYKGTPVGFMNFAPDGRFIAMVVDSSRQKPAGNVPTAAEAEGLFKTMIAYAGSYVVKESQVINHVDISWNETWTGTDQFRTFRFDGKQLHLSTPPSPNPLTGQLGTRTLSWERTTQAEGG
jgi:hypothetical protein